MCRLLCGEQRTGWAAANRWTASSISPRTGTSSPGCIQAGNHSHRPALKGGVDTQGQASLGGQTDINLSTLWIKTNALENFKSKFWVKKGATIPQEEIQCWALGVKYKSLCTFTYYFHALFMKSCVCKHLMHRTLLNVCRVNMRVFFQYYEQNMWFNFQIFVIELFWKKRYSSSPFFEALIYARLSLKNKKHTLFYTGAL